MIYETRLCTEPRTLLMANGGPEYATTHKKCAARQSSLMPTGTLFNEPCMAWELMDSSVPRLASKIYPTGRFVGHTYPLLLDCDPQRCFLTRECTAACICWLVGVNLSILSNSQCNASCRTIELFVRFKPHENERKPHWSNQHKRKCI